MKLIKYLMSIPKTILFNLKVFPFKIAIKLPVFIAYNVKLDKYYKNCILINAEISRFMIKINIDEGSIGVNHNLKSNGFFRVSSSGKMIFNGKANFAKGISIRVENGEIFFGNNFSCNRNCFFACSKNIKFGDNVLVGWDVNIRDSDGHKVYDLNGSKKDNSIKPVEIGNHVWIGSNVDILKGVKIQDDCIVGYNSCVTKKFTNKNCIIAGYPAKIVKENVKWEN